MLARRVGRIDPRELASEVPGGQHAGTAVVGARIGAAVDVVSATRECLVKPGATAEYPFGPQPLVFKVGGRIFAILAEEEDPPSISLKCEPELAVMLRTTWSAVVPGYHLNKRHWNTVTLDGTVPDAELAAWIEDSYDLVVDQLPRHVQQALRAPR